MYQIEIYHDDLEDEGQCDEQSKDDWNDSQIGSSWHDVKEYYDVFSANVHARQRLNKLRRAREVPPLRRLGSRGDASIATAFRTWKKEVKTNGSEGRTRQRQDEKLATDTEEERKKVRTLQHQAWTVRRVSDADRQDTGRETAHSGAQSDPDLHTTAQTKRWW